MGNLHACGKILRQGSVYQPHILDSFKVVASRCLLDHQKNNCTLLDDLPAQKNYVKLSLEKLEIGLTPEGKKWDIMGSSDPEVVLEMKIADVTIYHQRMMIEKIETDASHQPQVYHFLLKNQESLVIDDALTKDQSLHIKVIDQDPSENDLIGEVQIPLSDLTQKDLSFGSVKSLRVRISR